MNNGIEKRVLPACLVFFLCLLATQAEAAATITMTESQAMTFPTLALPSTGSSTLTISALSSATSGTAHIVSGTASRAIYALVSKGGGSTSISIDIGSVSTGSSYLTLSNFTGLYNGVTIGSFPSKTLSLPAVKPGSTPLYVGATLTALSGLATGNYAMSYTITITVL